MSKIDLIKSLLEKSRDKHFKKYEPKQTDYILDTLLAELASMGNVKRSEVGEMITKFDLCKNPDGLVTSMSFARQQRMPGFGHLPWPLNCHKTSTLCWPVPDNNGLIWCIEVEYPWPCPDKFSF